jgi:exodeoxyribonuclease V alpha subunit
MTTPAAPADVRVREAASMVRAMKAVCSSPQGLPGLPALRLAALTLRMDLPASLLSKDADGRLKRTGMPQDYVRALIRSFPDKDSTDKLAAGAELLLANLPPKYVRAALDLWGPNGALRRVSEEPYAAVWHLGGQVADADAVARGVGRRADDVAHGRVTWALLSAAKRGDTMVPVSDALWAMGGQASGQATLQRLNDAGRVVVVTHAGAQYVVSPDALQAENVVAAAVRERARRAHLAVDAAALEEGGLTAEQVGALQAVCSASIGVLTGGPGTGKTRCVRALVEALGASRCMLTAPTGRAARNLNGSTVHSASGGQLLRRRPLQETSKADVPTDLQLLVVDEASMLTTELMTGVLNLAPPTCHVLLVGDPDQLPPIGTGNVLCDLIESRACPVASLTTNHRSCGAVTELARRVLAGQTEGVEVVECESQGECLRACVKAAVGRGAQVLAPINATRALYNRALQSAFRSARVTMRVDDYGGVAEGTAGTMTTDADGMSTLLFGNTTVTAKVDSALSVTRPIGGVGVEYFARGDTVMVTKNQNKKRLSRGEVSACNGDIGTLVRPPVLGVKPLVDFGDGAVAEFPTTTGWLTLGYAATVHKFQGSECRIVALPLDTTWDRQLLYTAITRAQDEALLLGTREQLRFILAKQRPPRRSALLALLGAAG